MEKVRLCAFTLGFLILTDPTPRCCVPRHACVFGDIRAQDMLLPCHSTTPPFFLFLFLHFPDHTALLHNTCLVTDRFRAVDPWRPIAPHSDYYAQDRPDTVSEPFKLIPSTSLFPPESAPPLRISPLSSGNSDNPRWMGSITGMRTDHGTLDKNRPRSRRSIGKW